MNIDDCRNKFSESVDTRFRAAIASLLCYIEPAIPTAAASKDRAETIRRVAAMWREMTAGYSVDPASLLKTFEEGAQGVDEMVVVRAIPFYSTCEHHLLPFFGTATVGYVPSGRIVGLSKVNRLVDAFARRLQVQERLTNQIADAMQDALLPVGVGVVLNARHLCMESRGIRQQGCSTITSALRGAIRDKPEARAEFLALAR